MFHLLSCFDLKDGENIEEFEKSNELFFIRMKEQGMVESKSAIGRRLKHPVMDTDGKLDQEYYFTMSFLDLEQCNLAVDCIMSKAEPDETIHNNVSDRIQNHTFICWQDI